MPARVICAEAAEPFRHFLADWERPVLPRPVDRFDARDATFTAAGASASGSRGRARLASVRRPVPASPTLWPWYCHVLHNDRS